MNEIERRNRQDFWGRIAVMVGGLLILHLTSCSTHEHNREPVAYTLSGKCWNFNRINRQAKGREICGLPAPHRAKYFCSRREGHGGLHHSHLGQRCAWTW